MSDINLLNAAEGTRLQQSHRCTEQSDQLLVAPVEPARAAGPQGTVSSFSAGVAGGTAVPHVTAAHRL